MKNLILLLLLIPSICLSRGFTYHYNTEHLVEFADAYERFSTGKSKSEKDKILAYSYAAYITAISDMSNFTGMICIPEDTEVLPLINIVSNYLKNNQLRLYVSATETIITALSERYACSGDKT